MQSLPYQHCVCDLGLLHGTDPAYDPNSSNFCWCPVNSGSVYSNVTPIERAYYI